MYTYTHTYMSTMLTYARGLARDYFILDVTHTGFGGVGCARVPYTCMSSTYLYTHTHVWMII